MNDSSASQTSPFLTDHEKLEDSADEDYSHFTKPRPQNWAQRTLKNRWFHAILLFVNIVLLATSAGFASNTHQLQGLIYTPARSALELRVQEFRSARADPNPYMGMTDTADAAWHDLMQHTNIRLTEEDLVKLNRTSVALGDGGYLGMPAVYHELHCLKMIRWAFNMERYGDHFGQRDKEEFPIHIEHCIDMIRQTIMCHADTSPFTFRWTPNSRVPETDFVADHECVNWEKMEAWMEEHKVNIYAEGVLVHPEFGVSYPGGHRLIENWDKPKTIPPRPRGNREDEHRRGNPYVTGGFVSSRND